MLTYQTLSAKEISACVCMSSNLTWKKQVFNQTTKANKLLGYIRRNTQFITSAAARRSLYLALVRSHFGCATQLWAPQSIDLIYKLERTQRRATKYILNLPFTTDIEYKARLLSLHSRYVTGMNTWISFSSSKLPMVW